MECFSQTGITAAVRRTAVREADACLPLLKPLVHHDNMVPRGLRLGGGASVMQGGSWMTNEKFLLQAFLILIIIYIIYTEKYIHVPFQIQRNNI